MSRTKRSRPRGFTAVFAACGALAALLLLGTGCEEITSRREIQKGNRLYLEGRYRNAIEMYESALARTPDLDIGQHNAGLAYYKMFQPGLETPENKQMAEKAAAHFQAYLEQNPGDRKVISLLSTIWLDSGQYEKALAYWSDVLAKNPDSRDVIEKLANINRQAGQYDKALEWHMKRAEMESEPGAKVKVYLDIAQMQWSRLAKPDLVDAERVQVADVGLAILQKAEQLDPNHAQVQSLMGSLYQFRSLAHHAAWARAVESASQRYHTVRFSEITKAARASAAADGAGDKAAPAGSPAEK
ncbi:MAG TPA: tetratricopeptide repeat protein [Kofleriaceae bacterium]|nr:tetratricopeptide repeat protein [Kofleriaceae bacterium]